MEISDYDQYYQKGGTYVLPIEVFNELWGEMENWKDTCKQKENIIKEVREILINSKEYKVAKEMNLTSKMSVLIELLEILDKENK